MVGLSCVYTYVHYAVAMTEKQRMVPRKASMLLAKLPKGLMLWIKPRPQRAKNIGITLFAILQIDLKCLNHSPNVSSNWYNR